jgi:hypothetical protein
LLILKKPAVLLPIEWLIGIFQLLPLYDNFNIQLSGKELEELKVFWLNYGVRNEGIFVKPSFKLILSKLLAWNEGGFYEFTPLGKIPVGALLKAVQRSTRTVCYWKS